MTRLPFPRRRRTLLSASAFLAGLAATPLPGQAVVSGSVAYEKVPVTRGGLNLAGVVRTPAAGIRVEVLEERGDSVLASTFTGADGRYRISLPLARPTPVRVRARAETENARVVSASGRAGYTLVSPVRRAGPGRTVEEDLVALDRGRVSGPFNIAHTIWRANQVIRAAQSLVALPSVEIRWDTAYADGTFFRFSEKVAYINGDRGEDSDEFDDHVIIHEYGHFLMATFSREDSPGGDHGVGELLDPRLAWSEGWADFFSAVVMDDPVYLDTGVEDGRQTVRVLTNLEQDVPTRDRPGIWSEHSVGSALWDLYDSGVEPSDSVSLGFGPLWTAFAVALRKEPDPYLLDFIDALARGGIPVRGMARVLAARSISYPDAREVFPVSIEPGVAQVGTVDSRSTRRSNLIRSSAHFGFVLPQARQVTVTMKITAARDPERADLDLLLFDAKGNAVASSVEVNGVGDGERIVRQLDPGYYRAEVRSWSSGNGGRLGDANAHQGSFRLVVTY